MKPKKSIVSLADRTKQREIRKQIANLKLERNTCSKRESEIYSQICKLEDSLVDLERLNDKYKGKYFKYLANGIYVGKATVYAKVLKVTNPYSAQCLEIHHNTISGDLSTSIFVIFNTREVQFGDLTPSKEIKATEFREVQKAINNRFKIKA